MFWVWFISVLIVAFLLLAVAIYASGPDQPEAGHDREGGEVSHDGTPIGSATHKHAA